MIIHNLPDFSQAIEPGCRLIGIDYGRQRRGVALSDPGWQIAYPLTTLHGRIFKHDIRALIGIVEQHQVGGWIIGLPLHVSGDEGAAAMAVRRWAAAIAERGQNFASDPVIYFWDERMSTRAVARALATLSPRRRSQIIDEQAAVYILQGALDALAYQRTSFSNS